MSGNPNSAGTPIPRTVFVKSLPYDAERVSREHPVALEGKNGCAAESLLCQGSSTCYITWLLLVLLQADLRHFFRNCGKITKITIGEGGPCPFCQHQHPAGSCYCHGFNLYGVGAALLRAVGMATFHDWASV